MSIPAAIAVLPSLLLSASAPSGSWLISGWWFQLVVYGSIAGLVLATVVILGIWFVEWRNGRVW